MMTLNTEKLERQVLLRENETVIDRYAYETLERESRELRYLKFNVSLKFGNDIKKEIQYGYNHGELR